jgi:hypothetical protein
VACPKSQSFHSLEEACESWQYAVSDKFVYLSESTEALGNSGDVPTEIYFKLHGRIKIQFMLEGDRNAYYEAIICRFGDNVAEISDRQSGEVDHSLTPICRNPPMLVEVTYLVQPPKRVCFIGCPSVIWLKRFDLANGFTGDVNEPIVKRVQLGSSQDWAVNNRESSTFTRDSLQSSQTPNQLVQGGPHIIDRISSDQANGVGDIKQIKAEDVPLMFKVILSRKSIGIRMGKSVEFQIKKVKMALCPSKFHLGICCSAHGEEYIP